jgi:hypothetical protein
MGAIVADHHCTQGCPQGPGQFRKSVARHREVVAAVPFALQVENADHQVGAAHSFDLI